MICLWMEDFGGSIHWPALTFFFLAVGASTVDIGVFGTCRALGALLLAPVYGRSVDLYGVRTPLLICTSLCGFGCLLRGYAQSVAYLYVSSVIVGFGAGSSWSMVKGHVARHTEEHQRPMVVSGLRLQMMLISLSRILYPLLDKAVRVVFGYADEDELPRYRAAVMTCTTACWIGIAAIVLCRTPRSDVRPPLRSDSAMDDLSDRRCFGEILDFVRCGAAARCQLQLTVLVLTIAITACCLTSVNILWPVFLKHRFGWDARHFAYASTAETLTVALAITAYPQAATLLGGGRGGGLKVAELLAVGAACAVLIGYNLDLVESSLSSSLVAVLHTAIAVLGSASLGALGPCLETVASLYVPVHSQGAAMGALNAAFSLGGLFGPLTGTALWTLSLRADAWAPIADGRLPYLVIVAFLCVISVCLKCCVGNDVEVKQAAVTSTIQPNMVGVVIGDVECNGNDFSEEEDFERTPLGK
eukprot:TRINITY_DN8621_c0_g1_i1.p1 TRINITY_DN8621_c0_g1~~TRINITY_DN8621_c0_g1_i1.p1  ORF type:complete len:544 (+),score=44.72 TRINITY_DN8621_c0_g1_i1:216-1634(+)